MQPVIFTARVTACNRCLKALDCFAAALLGILVEGDCLILNWSVRLKSPTSGVEELSKLIAAE